MSLEIWKSVPNTEDLLKVSNLGNVKSECFSVLDSKGVLQTFKARIKKQTLGKNGYYHFRFRGKLYNTHRCIALCFVDGDHSLIINHTDGNKTNNLPSNLEWVTYSENNYHAVRTGLRDYSDHNFNKGEDAKHSKLTEELVLYILLNIDNINTNKLSKELNISSAAISNIMLGKSWKHVAPEIKRIASKGDMRKLSDEQVTFIRQNRNFSNRELAEMFNVCSAVISNIVTGKSYREVLV